MSSSHRRKLMLFVPFLVMLAITSTLGLALTSAAPPSPQERLAGVFAEAHAQASYHMVADVEQTLIPKAMHSNAGKGDQTSAMRVLGDMTRATRLDSGDESRARLLLYAGTERPVELILAGTRAYIGYNGRWQIVEDPLGGVAPGGDYLGYLAAATDVVEGDSVSTADGVLRRYTFNLDGPAFAEYQRQRAQATLAAQLPQGAQIQASPALQAMSGAGELWVDGNGLPRRQILDINLPNATERADARLHMVVDFSRYNDPIAPIKVPQPAGDGSGLVLPDGVDSTAPASSTTGNWLAPLRAQVSAATVTAGHLLAPIQQPLRRVGMLALAVLLGALALTVLGTQQRRRSLYVGVVSALVLTMVSQPLLEAGRLIRFDRTAEAAPLAEALQDVGALQGGTTGLQDYIARWQTDLAPRAVDTTDLQDCRSLYSDILPGEDSDGDGLLNETEWCLGTDYSNVDSDYDGITDTVEVEGFVYNNQTWTGNPLSSDSNGDGMDDGDEWKPTLTGDDFVNFIDFDHDGVPNLWDDDNDGDGVPDGNDISPFAVEPYRKQFQLTISGPQAGNSLYIDIQMRPITDHLRYSLTTLDWPADSLGQIQDLNNSTDDMQLIPVLEVESQISPTLSLEYGISARNSCTTGSNTVNCYSLWVPLQTVESAGKIYAYAARIALTSDEAQNVISSSPLLANGRIRWLTQAALDQAVAGCQAGDPNCTCDDSGGCVLTEESIVASYLEDEVQLTGVSITQIQDVQVGLFGTGTNVPQVSTNPNVPDEDKVLMQLMSAGLAGTYLYTDTAISELALNFTNPAQNQPITTTWGITPSIMHVLTGTYPHRDEALATTNTTTTLEMLNEHYVDCAVTASNQLTPTLALAYQETSGGKDLLNMTKQDAGVVLALSASLSNVPMATMHQTQLTTYACATGSDGQSGWQALPLASPSDQPYQSALGELSRRYPSQATQRYFSMVQQLFMVYYFGRSNIVAINGQPAIVAAASEAGFGWLIDFETYTMPDYVRKVYDLDSFFLAVDTRGTLDGMRDWSTTLTLLGTGYIGGIFLVRYMIPGLLTKLFKMGRWIVNKVGGWFSKPVNPAGNVEPAPDDPELSDAVIRDDDFDVLEDLSSDVSEVAGRQRLSAIAEESELSQDFVEDAATGASASMWAKVAGGAVAVAVTVVIIVITWVSYANNGLSGIQKSESKGQAEAATIVALAQLVLTLILIYIAGTGYGLLIELAIYVVIWLIWGIATGNWNPASQYADAMEWLTNEVFKYALLAKIPNDGTGVQSGQLQVTLGSSGGNSGDASAPTTGPMFQTWGFITTSITTTIVANPDKANTYGATNNRSGNADDVTNSWGFARWDTIDNTPGYLANYYAANTPNVIGESGDASAYCDVADNKVTKYCHTPTTSLTFKFGGQTISDTYASGRNTAIPVTTTIEANLRYEACYWDVIGYTCDVKTNYSKGPNQDSDKYSYFYFDVLPNTLDGLVQWNAYNPVSQTVAADFNADVDNDGLLNSQETADCTNGLPANATSTCATLWDSDGDGLSDGWEVSAKDAKGTDATKADTDGDGLTDYYELTAGTSVVISDTDSDGLLDGEELCRIVNGQQLGGWQVAQAGNYRTCSDPLKGDYDGDHLLDGQEKRAGLSPYAPNTAPWMELSNQPSVVHNGAHVSVLKAGDPLTLTLYLNNTTAAGIVHPLTLDYATSVLVTPTVVTQTGSDGYIPPTPGETASGLSWNLSANPLYALEAMTSTLATNVDPNITTSQVTSLLATAIYSDVVAGEQKTITETISVLVDMDAPTSVIDSPASGAAIKGTAYTIGGTASDPTSWPTQVEVRVTGNSYDSGWQDATGAGSWGWTWMPLPADGVYTVESRATDYAGNVQATPATATVIVDNTAPAAGLVNFTGGVLQLTGNLVTLYVSGDDTLSGAAQVAGLQLIQISIDGRPWTNVSNSEIFTSPHPPVLPAGRTRPYYKWTVNNAAYGSHTITVRAVDALGQVGDATTFDVIIDTLPPTDIWSNYQPYLPAGQAVELLGHADDEGNVPLPARPQALENTLDAVISSTVQLMPEAYTDTVGMTVAWLGDVNSDARADLAVGMPAATVNGKTSSGRISIIYGQPGGWPVPPDVTALANATTSFAGVNANSQLGQYIAPAGDVNSDGLNDILIGDPSQRSAYVVYGSTSSLGTDISPASLGAVQAKTLTVASGLAGTWQAPAGDVDGDGFDDLLLGVTGINGAARLYLASGKIIKSSSAGILKLDAATGSPAIETIQLDGNGAVATGVGDVNNDQYDDFVVADPNNSFGGGAAIYLFLGPPTWRQTGVSGPLNPATYADASFPGSAGVGSQVVALGDVNGDTLPDFAYSDGTTPKVVYGRTSGWTTGMSPSVTFSGSTAFDAFIAAPGDVNADGLNDVLLGSTSAGGRAFLYHGRSDLATNQPVQAEISGVAAAASAPYAAGADLNCDLSSDLLVVPVGQFLSVESADGSLKVREQRLSSSQQGQWIGPAPAPWNLLDLPQTASLSPARAATRAATDLGASLTTPAVAFRVVDNNITDWATADAMVGDFDGDGKTDVAGWSSSTVANEPSGDGGEQVAPESVDTPDVQASEALTAELPVTDTDTLDNPEIRASVAVTNEQPLTDTVTLDSAPASAPDDGQITAQQDGETPTASWRIWHSDGYSTELSFTEYSNNLPAAVTGSTARLLADFDGDNKTDIGYWDGAAWQFVRSDGASGTAFSFSAATSNLGGVASGDTSQTFLGDFDGDLKSDIAAWDGSAWATYLSAASGTTFNFTQASNNLGALSGSSAAALVVGDFDGDGATDVASRASDSANWVVWLSEGLSGGSLTFQQVTATSLGYAITSSVPRTVADFSGDGKADVLALFNNTDFYAWLSQASPSTGAAPFRKVLANALQFGGTFPTNTLIGDFDGDGASDYASPNGSNWVYQLSDLATTRVIDDDFCEACANDGLVWGQTAFATIQSALDASWHSDILLVQPGTYAPTVINAGRDFLTLRGTDPDAVFLDAGGGVGISLLPNPSTTYPNITGVTIENLTIRNASTAIKVNFGGDAFNNPGVSDGDNVVIRNVLFYQDAANSTAVQASESAVWLRHNTLISNAPGVTLVHSMPGSLTSNYMFLQDNLFVALPNASPLPRWWRDNVNQLPGLVSHNGFASENGVAGDWFAAPNGSLMTVANADFLNVVEQVFRIGASSQALNGASDGKAYGYYNYHVPVTVDATFCQSCDNDGLVWGQTAFNSIQDAVASGAQRVLIDPGVYRERVALVNGVSLFGSGAGLTILAPPDPSTSSPSTGSGQALLGVENARLASVSLMTIAGAGTADGIQIDGRGSLTLKRAVIRNTGTAISVSGGDALATLVNDTLVSNDNGLIASDCGSIDVRNTILAYHQDTALGIESCASTALHTYNAYWQNGHDLQIDGSPVDQPGPGEIFANPRFTDPNTHDYRPQANSPVVDAGDPSDPAPPGSGDRVDLGYAQSAEAAVYASQSYCEQCLNDGLEWQVTAFDTIQDAIDNVPDIAGIWTVGVAGGSSLPTVYHERLTLPSGVRLIGAGPETTVIDADDSGSAISLDGVTNVQITGFTITNGGENPTDAGISVDGASNNVTISRNIIGGQSPDANYPGNGNYGVYFANDSTGSLSFNTVALNYSTGVALQGDGSWLQARYNIVALNDSGFDNSQGGQLFNAYNLVYNTDSDWCLLGTCTDYLGTLSAGPGEINSDPLFTDPDNGDLRLALASPAIDAIPAAQYQPVPTGGNSRADMGYDELLAMPATLLLGKEGNSCGLGSAGVASVQVGLVYVPNSAVAADETPPSTWQNATLATAGEAGSYWTTNVTPSSGDGLYRLYSRPIDVASNVASRVSDWYRAAFIADGTPPAVSLVAPASGTTSTAPAVTLSADVLDWTPTGVPGQNSFTVDNVTFLVDSTVITATQAVTVASPGEAQRYTAQVALDNGTHSISAVATDLAGNVGQSSAVSLTVVTTQNEAALSDPAPGSAVSEAAITLKGYVHFQDSEGSGQVEVLVDNISQGTATLADASAQATSWSKPVTFSGDGSHTVTLRASRTAGTSAPADSQTTLTLDTTGPTISFQPPSETVTRTVTLDGSASDPSPGSGQASGLAAVAVSVDGGHSYADATLATNGDWTYAWEPDLGNDYAGFPLRVRATDSAGNATVDSATLTVDNLGPTPISLVSVSPQEGSHIQAPATVQLDWLQSTDGSGSVTIYAAVDQITGTVPAQTSPIGGNSYAAAIDSNGTWYVHLLAVDGTGNQTVRHFGPWFGESNALGIPGPVTDTWQSSVQINGYLDIAHGEWEPETELLGSDPRPELPVSLYATWDSDDLFLAWRGPRWGPDGSGFIHLDTQPGGTTVPYGGATGSLPFEADFAVVSGPTNQQLLAWNGSSWQPVGDPNFLGIHGASTATEIRVPRSAINATGAVRLHAFTLDDSHFVRSVLPDLNPLDGPWTTAYNWPGLVQELDPNAGQPDAHHTRVTIAMPTGDSQVAGPGSALDYVFNVRNIDDYPLDAATLIVSGSDGLRFESLSGWPPPGDTPQDDRWFIDLGTLQPDASLFLTITARVKQTILNTDAVTVTAKVQAGVEPGEPALSTASLSHPVDGRPPTVSIDLLASGATLPSGAQTVAGTAHDSLGSGVARVEVRVDDGTWMPTSGTRSWTSQINVPSSGQLTLSARAFDIYGLASDVDSVLVTVDNIDPSATIDPLPPAVGGAAIHITGTASDTFPAGGTIALVQIKIDNDPWRSVEVGAPDQNGQVAWSFRWTPVSQEGVAHQIWARAVDAAGNTGPATGPTDVTVDTVAPSSMIAYPEPGAVLNDRQVLVWGLAADGWGVGQVDVSLDGGTTWDAALLGQAARDLLASLGVPDVPPPDQLPAGMNVWAIQLEAQSFHLAIRSRATDLAGNREPLQPPVRSTIQHLTYWLPLVKE